MGRAGAGPVAEEDGDAEVVAFERQRLLDALDEARGNKSEAARLLGMPRSTFCSKLKKHELGVGEEDEWQITDGRGLSDKRPRGDLPFVI